MTDYTGFKPAYLTLEDAQFLTADVDFWIVEGYPVIEVFDGKTGMIALFGKPRTFPLDAAYAHGERVTRNQFLAAFPDLNRYFTPQRQAEAA